MNHSKYFFGIITLFAAFLTVAQTSGFGEAPILSEKSNCLSDEHRKEILNILDSRKTTKESSRTSAVRLSSPIRQSSNYDHFEIIGISNFVDHNSSTGNLLDYNCGARTYDTESGYDHAGTDIYSWPFTWHKMEHDQVEIIAAAAGTIIYKQDENYDKSCSFNSNQWNAVYVEHSDGSVAWYGHLKKFSLTSKEVGDRVAAGDFLGIMGSSGNSTGPHLHLEIYDASNKLIDPYAGDCNNTTNSSWWSDQEDYTIPGISMLSTNSEPPVFGCTSENPNFEINFSNGDLVIFTTYFRDQLDQSQSDHRVIKPDGSLFTEWVTTSTRFFSGSYWYRSFNLPESGDEGKWTFEVTYQGQTMSQHFYLSNGADSEISITEDRIVFDSYLEGDVISGSFEVNNVGESGIIIDGIEYPASMKGNWDGIINASESKTIEFEFTSPTSEPFEETISIDSKSTGTKTIQVVGKPGPLSLKNDADLNLYPNPVTNGSLNFSSTEPKAIKIFSIEGRLISQQKVTGMIDVSELKSGIYIIHALQNGHTFKKKVIVNN